MRELTESQANRIESALHEDIAQGRFLVRPVETLHYERAFQWLLTRKTSLRALDALQLACAEGISAELVTLDATMRSAAEYYGLDVHDINNN